MIYRNIIIPAGDGSVSLTVYAPDNFPAVDMNRRRPAVVLCPGGGYHHLSCGESEPVALQLVAADCCVCIVRYDVAPAVFPTALIQLAAAVAHIRSHAEEYYVNLNKILVMGFSAGGHLACSLGVRWHEPWLSECLGLQPEDIRPNGMVLCYPVITAGEFAHRASFKNLTASEDPSLHQQHSLERLVTDKTPPAFLWHTTMDTVVPTENTLLFFSALRRCGVNGEMHIYPEGDHGLALASRLTTRHDEYIRPAVQNWFSMAVRWIHQL